MYTGTENSVKCGGCPSSFFLVKSGMSMPLFLHQHLNLCMNWMIGRDIVYCTCQVILGNMKVTEFDFSDVAILSESLETGGSSQRILKLGESLGSGDVFDQDHVPGLSLIFSNS